ncbi:MAG: hypothetical protein HGA47_09715 [Zoogloea sp.]|nr:hypothetical protein [Zoogloea sp.]
MKIRQTTWTRNAGWHPADGQDEAGLVLVFGATDRLTDERFAELRAAHPAAVIVGCSTSGEIRDTEVLDDTLVATAVSFASTTVRVASAAVGSAADSHAAGESLGRALPHEGLVHVLVLSDGLNVNGTELSSGLRAGLPEGVAVTGGLSGDAARFARTLVIADAPPAERMVAAVGFYGEGLRVGYGSLGGWEPFGPDRVITRSAGNVLYELDGEPALALYKRYLGEHAAGLPATGLLFPLALRGGEGDPGLVRTILAVDEAAGSITFAGDMPQGCQARLMKANFDKLVEGASSAAESAHRLQGGGEPELALLISCVGRKLVLAQRIEDEVEGVREVLGPRPVLAGFYSYGELSPHLPTGRCELHNQTMTITTLGEAG